MDYFKSCLGWAMAVVQKHQTSEPKADSKAYWQWRTATLEIAAIDKNCRETGAMPIFALQSVNFSEVNRDHYKSGGCANVKIIAE